MSDTSNPYLTKQRVFTLEEGEHSAPFVLARPTGSRVEPDVVVQEPGEAAAEPGKGPRWLSAEELAPQAQDVAGAELSGADYWKAVGELRHDSTKALFEHLNEGRPKGARGVRLSDIRSAEGRSVAVEIVSDKVALYWRRQAEQGRSVSVANEQQMTTDVINALFKLGRLQPLVDNSEVKEIFVKGNNKTTLVQLDGTKTKGPPVVSSDEELVELLQFWADRAGRKFSESDPFLNMSLFTDEGLVVRIQAGVVWSRRPELTVRLHRHLDFSLSELVDVEMLSSEVADFLVAAVRAGRSVVMAGDQGSGKTTLMRALIRASLEPDCRLLTIEREYELGLTEDEFENIISAQAIEGGGERDSQGNVIGQVNPTDIMERAAQRVSAEVLIVGEVKDADEVTAMMSTMHTSPRAMSTTHGKNAEAGLDRLIDLYHQSGKPYDVAAKSVSRYIDIVVHSQKGVRSGHHVTQVIHVEEGEPTAITELFHRRGGQLVPVDGGWSEALDGLADHGYSRPEYVARRY